MLGQLADRRLRKAGLAKLLALHKEILGLLNLSWYDFLASRFPARQPALIMLRLDCQAQNYAWGRLARSDSQVAALRQAAGGDVDSEKPYAELWMGTHPSGPSTLANSCVMLLTWLEQHPETLGHVVLKRFGCQLPFLFKVLSVQTALSIQSHPDKELAERLHADQPEVYKDANHKPEMALAVTDFEALCGFCSHSDLDQALRRTPELQACIGQDVADQVLSSGHSQASRRAALVQSFTQLMTADPQLVFEQVTHLTERLQQQVEQGQQLGPKEQLVLRLHEQYPYDVGILSAYFLNYLRLQPGQALYLEANIPHAYLSGQLIECMATSDNVIRAGLTPKLRDTKVLCDSLTYSQEPPDLLDGQTIQEYTRLYSPPFDEFEVVGVHLPPGRATIVPANDGPMIVLVFMGRGQATSHCSRQQVLAPELEHSPELSKGSVFFVPACTSLDVAAAQDEELHLWIASCNSRLFSDKFRLPPSEHIPSTPAPVPSMASATR